MPDLTDSLGSQTTLASLQPAPPKELHYPAYKNRLRLHGSQFMTLKKPSRLAEFGREYVAGDPVNLIDWKAFARTDQLIIREVRDESAAQIIIGVDLSLTMQWPTADVPQAALPTKAEIAVRVAMHLAYAHLRMGDQVEMWLLTDAAATRPTHLYKPRRAAAVQSSFELLREGKFAPTASLAIGDPADCPQTPRDVAFWVGDGLGPAQISGFLARGRRSFFLHTLSSLELRTDWFEDGTSYFDQGDQLREYQGQALKQRGLYLAQLQAWQHEWRDKQRHAGGDYLTVSDKTTITQYQAALMGFIKARTA